MKVFIMTDLEGATGVAGDWSDFNPGGREHDSARRLLTGDVNSAIQGAYDGGVSEVVVLDGHGAAFSILLEDFDSRAQLIRGRRASELEGLDASFNLMLCIGVHSMAGTPDGLLTHTLSHTEMDNVWLNNTPVGEIGLWAALAGHFNVPIGLVVGEASAIREAKSLLGNIETVAVKEATSRFAAKCLHPQVSWSMIRSAAEKAVKRINEFKPFKPEVPMELKVQFHNSDRAESVSKRHGAVRIDGRTVICRGSNVLDIYNVLLG
ncbi:M55 family metallopeptidase [Candidatus Bathyarchaeota archaeon]|nr:M55 family metallopeptidase [Candidatus Bathyarchaeota archaeon]